ncbi:hypothetical protein [Halorussus litoreus]|uniref:hypothetical protein n=1 Tax=Halorussus litoreus TaxID=1710536 RepID=UPI000E26CA51|nr:hypothetical protein [Halorussus litoreus]
MNRSGAGLLAAVVLLGVLGVGALAGGLAPGDAFEGLPDEPAGSGRTTTATDSGTPSEPTGTATAAATTATAGEDAGYDFAIQRIESCGTTCRDVTARLTNVGSEAREDVRVTTSLYADGDLLWQGNETVGRLDAGEAHTSTKRVKLGYADGAAIQGNDGYVTIITVVRSADGTARFEERRKVA